MKNRFKELVRHVFGCAWPNGETLVWLGAGIAIAAILVSS